MMGTTCRVLQFIRDEKSKAAARLEYAEVKRRELEEKAHLEKCVICAMPLSPLFLQLWPNAQIGIDSLEVSKWHQT